MDDAAPRTTTDPEVAGDIAALIAEMERSTRRRLIALGATIGAFALCVVLLSSGGAARTPAEAPPPPAPAAVAPPAAPAPALEKPAAVVASAEVPAASIKEKPKSPARKKSVNRRQR